TQFLTVLPYASAYNVTVLSVPTQPNETCTVTNGTGSAGVTLPPPSVSCAPVLYPITVNVTGLSGSGLVLQDNGGDSLAVGANGQVTFPTKLNSVTSYNVTILTQPTNPNQKCTVTNGKGVPSANASPP